MTGILELSVLVLAIIAAIILYKVLKTVKRMVINTVVGIVLLVVANLALGLDIAYSWVVILICAIGGAVGAILVIVLHCGGIAF
ncbi:MAG: pro-sigmaK processing inhibitor BofA family protein [Euryarchaeota archaeon]|nr:pro-sigmaK processing inhibitor BofA family protein [Euryarchaeota archaeon]